MKKFVRIAGIGVAAFAALFVGASAAVYFLVDLDALVSAQIEKARPALEEALGRKVEVGAAHVRFFPRLGGKIEGVTIAAADEGGEPLAKVGSAGFDLNLLKALLSAGQQIELSAIWLDGLRIHVERDANGVLSFQDILDRHPSEPKPAADEPAEGLSPEVQEWLRKVSIGEVRVAGGAITLVDRQTATGKAAENHIEAIDLRVRDVRLSDPLRIELSAAIFAPKPNFELAATVGPLPNDLKLDGLPPVRGVRLRADAVDLGSLAPYLGRALPVRIDSAVVSTSWDVPELVAGRPVEVAGFLEVEKLRVAGGESFDLRVDSKLSADLSTLSARIEKLGIRAAGMELAIAGSLRDLDKEPRFEGFTVRSKSLDPAKILAIYPPARANLPEGSRLAGPFTVDVDATGTAERQTVKAAVDLAQVDILVPGAIAKPAGTALGLRVDGDFGPAEASLRAATFQVDELALTVSGTVKNFAAPTYDFTIGAKPFSFDRLVRLAPAVGEELRKANASASGSGRIDGHVKGSPGSVDGQLAVALEGLQVKVPGTHVEGGTELRLSAKGDPAGDLQASFLLDAGTSVIHVDGLMNKGAGTPLRVDVAAHRKGGALGFERFDVRLAELSLQATGSLDPSGEGRLRMHLAPVNLEKLAATFPSIPAEKVKGGTMEAELEVQGDPSKLETVTVALPRLDLRLGQSDLQITAKVRNLDAPEGSASIRSRFLDLDALRGPDAPETADAAKPAAQDDPSLKRFRFTGDFDLKKVVVTGRELENLKGRITLRDGVVSVEETTFGAYGGSFQANGTRAEIWKGQMPFHARFEGRNVDVSRLVAAETKKPSPLSGRADLSFDLSGNGTEKPELEKYLTGDWSLSMREGRMTGLGLGQAVFGDLSGLPGFAKERLSKDEGLRDLLAGFEVHDGKMKLRRPLAMALDGNPVVLDGAIGIFGELALEGSYTVASRRIEQLTGGHCKPTQDPVVPLKITGPATAPEVRPDGGKIAVEVAKACLAGKAEAVLDKLLGGEGATKAAKEKLEGGAAAITQDAKAEVDAQAEKAKAELEAAKAAAERAKKEAEDKAKQKAKDAAGSMKKKLGF
ncbi:AsmA family protein [Vulgatibacter incomptus]|uniref:AsmA family protein n=1 Tax=Vulgatibacter incomptus TaxID=1391653 RepID=A0A0K1PAS9_9BACT|nr:AsmA family protein [Vulgatibacter incomptus]AKU90521.1 AsmA family protein [Vulgatibacter incomptus]